jgi:mannose-6-phosphate isomerase-like protein (cupin superfamily)
MSKPYALEPGHGWTYAFGPNFVIKAGERGTNGAAFTEMLTKKGEEPGTHTHETEDEMFYVVEGDVAFHCGDENFELGAGGFVFLPRGIPHGYTLRSDGDVRMIIITTPPRQPASDGWGGLIGDLERG